MSGRLFRRVVQEQEELRLRPVGADGRDGGGEESDDSGVDESRRPAFQNPFDLLDDEENEIEASEEMSAAQNIEEPFIPKNSFEVVSQPKSKGKKKKNKDAVSKKSKQEDEKFLDLILENLSLETTHKDGSYQMKSRSSKFIGKQNKLSSSTILNVDPKFLRAENELRRIFGSKVVSSFENGSSKTSRQIHGGRRGTHAHRKTMLVSPPGYWPRWDGSLSMELVETKNGKQFFRYVHSPSYSEAQRAFDAARALNDINGIASIVAYYPYHIESLWTIAEFLKFSGEHQSVAEYIAKCLYALECAWSPLFTPFQGNCGLNCEDETNKMMFTVIFGHMQNMDRRGCHRSALEICKLLLSINSDDPMGALFCIDYFALRAEEYSWLERFAEEYETGHSVWLFPNFSYSLAVARFYLEKDDITQTDKSSPFDLMKQALMLHPLVLKKLVAKAPLKDAAWAKILKHVFFGSAKAGSPTIEHLIDIYVERNYLLWRYPDLQKLLRDAAHLVIDSLNSSAHEVRDWQCVRKAAFPSDRNEYAHLLVSSFSDTVPTAPPEELRNMMIAPQLAEAMHDRERQEILIPEEEGGGAPRDLQNRNRMMLFLESLWVPLANLEVPENLPQQDNENNRQE